MKSFMILSVILFMVNPHGSAQELPVQEWNVIITAYTMIEGQEPKTTNSELVIGLHPQATEHYDPDIDGIMPPAPPSLPLAGLYRKNLQPEMLTKDIRNSQTICEEDSIVWTIKSLNSPDVLRLEWDPERLPSTGSMTIYTLDVNGDPVQPMDMFTSSEYEYRAPNEWVPLLDAFIVYKADCLQADFMGTPLQGTAPLIVQFQDQTNGYPASWQWDFGDGSPVSEQQNPAHTYDQPGQYSVTLSIDDGEDTITKEQYIMVLAPLSADFEATPLSGTAPLTVQFQDRCSGEPVAWQWDFGDGSPLSEQQNPAHTYDQPGQYSVTLTLDDGDDTISKEQYITVLAPVSADFEATPLSGTAPLTVQFQDRSGGEPVAWQWDFGDGSGGSEDQNPAHVYDQPGQYNVTLTIDEGRDSITRENYITVVQGMTVNFKGEPTEGSLPLSVQFQDLTSGKAERWQWDFGDNTLPSTEQNPLHIYQNQGLYTVTLTVNDSAFCQKTDYINVQSSETDSDRDGILDIQEGSRDRDDDGVPNYLDYDPTGFIYDISSGALIKGGRIEVQGPGSIEIIYDGSAGFYQFHTDGTPGLYELTYSPPSLRETAESCHDQAPPPLDLAALAGSIPFLSLGDGRVADQDRLVTNECTPFYTQFILSDDSPILINNNIPIDPVLIPIELSYFCTFVVQQGVKIEWVTQTESENSGFDILRAREPQGPYQMINEKRIDGAGNSSTEQRYAFIDKSADPGKLYYYKLLAYSFEGKISEHGPISAEIKNPDRYELGQNYPNPFNMHTSIPFKLSDAGRVQLKIYNLQGQTVRALVNQTMSAGSYVMPWDGRDDLQRIVPGGVYLYKLTVNGMTMTRKLNLVK
ncbi:PKD domain-containing protein [candidate division KSB1 bacterium]|nr:PKD domain-containing protein [candidate division KSB1 bacterium]